MKHEHLKGLGFKQVYYSSYRQGYARGVAILIANKINFKLIQPVTLLNVYRPAGNDQEFIKSLFNLTAEQMHGLEYTPRLQQ